MFCGKDRLCVGDDMPCAPIQRPSCMCCWLSGSVTVSLAPRTLSQLPVRSCGGGGGFAPPMDAIMSSAASSAVMVLARSAKGDGRGMLGALGGGSLWGCGVGCRGTSCRPRTCAAIDPL